MATIITKNSGTASSVPTGAQLTAGELAVNTADKRLFTKNGGGTVVELGTNPSSLILPNGTANGVPYLNGSKVLTSGSALTFDGTTFGITGGTGIQLKMYNSGLTGTQASSIGVGKSETAGNTVFLGWANNSGSPYGYLGTYGGGSSLVLQPDGGNLGLGVTPSAWWSGLKALQINSVGAISASTGAVDLSNNYYYNGTNNVYLTTGYASLYSQTSGQHIWKTAPSGTAGAAITFTQAMTLAANSELNIDSGTGGGRLTFTPGNASNTISATTTGFGAYNTLTLNGSQHIFQTSGTERARIDSSGALLVGRTSKLGEEKLAVLSSGGLAHSSENNRNLSGDVNGYWAMGTNTNNTSSYFLQCVTAGVGGKFYIYGNGTYGTVSDVNLKKNIETARNGYLADLMRLRVVKYNWKTDAEGTPKELGWIAQELAEVFPGLVQDSQPDAEGNVTKEVKTSVLPFMLLKAIQEQQAIIEQLKAQLTSVSADVAALKGTA